MLTYILTAFCIAANFGNKERLKCVLMVFAMQFGFQIAFDGIQDPFIYYGSATSADLITIVALYTISLSDFSCNLQLVCFASLMLNVFGYLVYQFGFQPAAYNSAWLTLLIIQTIVMLWGSNGYINNLANSLSTFLVRQCLRIGL